MPINPHTLSVRTCVARTATPVLLDAIVVVLITYHGRHKHIRVHLDSWMAEVDALILTTSRTTTRSAAPRACRAKNGGWSSRPREPTRTVLSVWLCYSYLNF